MQQLEFDAAIAAAIDGKTKPLGALGDLEILAGQIARIQKTLTPRAETATLAIFAGDHGIASAGVSAYPQAVTRQMVLNFLSGGAAANVFAKSVGADVIIVDAGVAGKRINDAGLVDHRIASGTENALHAPAITMENCRKSLSVGEQIGSGIASDVACFGEMGIGNTSSASLLAAKRLGVPVSGLVGRGTGLDDEAVARKASVLEQAAARTEKTLDPIDAFSEYGGYEIVMMAGAMIGAAKTGRIIIVDGFIASVAALYARAIDPDTEQAFIFSHKSAEAGHAAVLKALDAHPLLDLGLRLGEGTGALLAYPLVKAAAAMLREMASFESANVSGPV
ncbi:MAG: nicotinate-nucleotide--dimethylbenzimidazole phosphoribosyltransferase [Pseudomonadota bacterium]